MTNSMNNSHVGDAWIYQTLQQVPIQPVVNTETGQPTGDYLTGPVRICFETLFELPPPSAKNENPSYGATILFTPWHDLSILRQAWHDATLRAFPESFIQQTGQFSGVHTPFHDQADKIKYSGFTPGCVYLNVTSKYQPWVGNAQKQPVGPDRAYAGAWAIATINVYDFNNKTKGCKFGLQSLMIIGDDEKLGGKGPDPEQSFKAAQGIAPPPGTAAMVQGGMPPSQAPAAPPYMPAPPPGGTYAAAPPPAAPPPAASSPLRGPVPEGFDSWAQYDMMMGN